MVAIIEDITREKEMEEQLRKALDEKELLLAEVLHRVNNNLALITSFLEMELENIENISCRSVFKKSHIRIKTIGIVHQKLYQADDFSNLPLVEYVQEILATVSRNWSNGIGNASFKSNAADVKLNVNQAIPCGLILNELVTNAYKHAFHEGKKDGEINVEIRKNGNVISFSVSDNGIGLPDTTIFEEANTLGFTIVNILCQQLHAEVEIDTSNGTQFEISFIEDRYKKGAASNLKA